VKRFLRRLEPATPRATVRIETPPGHDYGTRGDMVSIVREALPLNALAQ
jgi:hypothetical protein